ncbi:undecaprenyl-phosphate glucose phosphotransferase [Rhodoblastus acidophilus]|uniref:undecaprenyl-phosphate glucose phosphotransferase n=1 Tax=Rhodoblastus acidophilus TaxID=1074 RepID=UPI002223F117|nr:undecaprenyl-phosphate glucose phosphotransferase [Rhodoblastus acidophilus]
MTTTPSAAAIKANGRGSSAAGRIPLAYSQIGFVVAAIDFASVTTASVLCDYLYDLFMLGTSRTDETGFLLGIAASFVYVALGYAKHAYRSSELLNGDRSATQILTNWTTASCVVLVIGFLGKVSSNYSRGAESFFFLSVAAALPALRYSLRKGMRFVFAAGWLMGRSRIVLFGSLDEIGNRELSAELHRHGYRVAEQFAVYFHSSATREREAAIDSAVEQLKEYIRQNEVDEIFMAFGGADHATIQCVIDKLRSLPTPVRMLLGRQWSALLSGRVNDLGATKAVRIQTGALTFGQQTAKRTLDVMLSLIGLVVLAPVLAIIAVAVALDSPGPVMFRQRRAGFGGRQFLIFKFRSMTTMDDGPVVRQATPGDDRVTAVGRCLRRTSLDELPQLINVLRGEMSLVGPRPHALSHDDEYDQRIATYALRRHMKPGITGWAQISGFRGETSDIFLMEKRVENDYWYICNWSFLLDVKILIKTTLIILSTKGAY